jgi:hypothetical protein
VIAYKFLAEGAISPFTGFRWPRTGEWVTAPRGRPDAWIHACRVGDLPHWLDHELWSIELDEPVRASRHQLASPRARLVDRIADWNGAFAHEYAVACALRARDVALPHVAPPISQALSGAADLPAIAGAAASAGRSDHAARYVRDAAVWVDEGAAVVSYIAATLASSVGGGLAGFEAERAWQARWLAERLGLPGARP